MARDDIVAKVVSQQELAPNIFFIGVHAPDISKAAMPGQFCMIDTGCSENLHDPLLRRPLSIHNVHTENGMVEFLYRKTGRGTNLLSKLEKNSHIRIMGPLGNGFRWNSEGQYIVVGGGMGIAPLLFLIRRMQAAELTPKVILGAVSATELVRQDAFIKAAEKNNLFFTTEDGSLGLKGLVTKPLSDLLRGASRRDSITILTCGPFPMMRAVAAMARENAASCQVSLEAHMACGSGLCLGCAVPTADDDAGYIHVCREGPVVDAEKVMR